MARFFDYSEKGILYTDEDNHETGGLVIHAKGDCRPSLEWAARKRNSPKQQSAKGDFHLYATIPPAIELVLRDRGINIYDKNSTKDLIRVIETEYPKLKCTELKHRIYEN